MLKRTRAVFAAIAMSIILEPINWFVGQWLDAHKESMPGWADRAIGWVARMIPDYTFLAFAAGAAFCLIVLRGWRPARQPAAIEPTTPPATRPIDEKERKEYANLIYMKLAPAVGALTRLLGALIREHSLSKILIHKLFVNFVSQSITSPLSQSLEAVKDKIDNSSATTEEIESAFVSFYTSYAYAKNWAVLLPECLNKLSDMQQTPEFKQFIILNNRFFDDVKDFTLMRPSLREQTGKRGMDIEKRLVEFQALASNRL